MGERGRSKHAQAQAKFIYVLKGRLALRAGTELQHPGVGDSLHFDSQTPHRYSHSRSKPCSALVITADCGRELRG